MRRVLLIAYDFPPRGGTGVFRVAKFGRYLPDWGWQPVVVTVADAGPYPDPRLLDELPAELEVLRVKTPVVQRASAAGEAGSMLRGRSGWRARLRAWIVPDPQLVWVPGAVRVARSRLEQGDITAIMTSGPPFSTHLAGWWLKRQYPGIPWLIDMRDLWSEGREQRSLVRFKLNRGLEQRCLRVADHTTVVSDGIRALTIRRLGADPARISTLTNGFDPGDLLVMEPSKAGHRTHRAPAGPLLLCYVGTIAASQAVAAEGLFVALSRLAAEGVDRNALCVQFIGTFAPQIHRWAAPLVAAGLVEFLPFVPHALAIQHMAGADVLLLVLNDDWEGRIAHTNKLFEYLALGQPILALAQEGEVTRLLRTEAAGLSAPPRDVDAIAVALRQLMALHAAGQLRAAAPDPDRFRRFHRRQLAGRLARLLDQMASED